MSREGAVEQFCTITGASEDAARQTLDACDWQLDVAINVYVDGESVSTGVNTGSRELPPSFVAPFATSAAAAAASASSDRGAAAAADGADARAFYHRSDEEVRAPIPQKTETMVTGHAYGTNLASRRRSRPCVFRDIRWETQEQEERLISGGAPEAAPKRPCTQRLEAMFKPPTELLFNGSYEEAKAFAAIRKLWLLLDVQNQLEFGCLTLNRDLWSRDRVKALVRKHCVMVQVFHDSEEGARYCRFHGVPEWPHVAILHPATGERLGSWTAAVTSQASDKVESFVSWLSALLVRHPSPTEYDGQAASAPRRPRAVAAASTDDNDDDKPTAEAAVGSILDEAEEQQLQFALQQSLKENQVSSSSARFGDCSDEDDDGDGDENDSAAFDDSEEPSLDGEPSKPAASHATSDVPASALAASNNCGHGIRLNSAHQSVGQDDWHQLLGDPKDPLSNIAVRLPDQSRTHWSAPCSTTLEALLLFIKQLGYPTQSYDIVVNFPRRVLNSCDRTKTLAELGLHPQETVFVHQR